MTTPAVSTTPPPPPVAWVGHTAEAVARVLRGSQAELVARSGDPARLDQPGGVCLAERFPVPVPGPGDPVQPDRDDPVIETFVVEGAGRAAATGPDLAVTAWWQPAVDELVARVRAALGDIGLALDAPAYLTASATPLDRVAGEAHLDDDRYRPASGPGIVAIAASHVGPRLAVGHIGCRPLREGAPLEVDRGEIDDFDRRPAEGLQQVPDDRIVLLARFGQLHAGPGPDPGPSDDLGVPVRTLLVLRAATVPVGSG
jgi:hypothetical protein